MKIVRVSIKNYRGIHNCNLFFGDKVVLVGDNNTGKSTILNAIDLVLGPERLNRFPVVNEHDFHGGQYLGTEGSEQEIFIELVVTDLSAEQQRYFGGHIEWWNSQSLAFINPPTPESTDIETVSPAIRVFFSGKYTKEEDNFEGGTFYSWPKIENEKFQKFTTKDKRYCGFLLLRTLRTGSRALSLERGSLLDIILRLKEKRLTMWEEILEQLRSLPVAENTELGIGEILETVQDSVKELVPSDWIENPKLKISDLTREHLRKILTLFIETGAIGSNGQSYSAPFYYQGTGTANMIVLALLSQIAKLKQNVIFAMEEPEIAIAPHTQKQVVKKIWMLSSQSIFTSHSPYILEEFDPSGILVLHNNSGELAGCAATLPESIKLKRYRREFRKSFCEALLAKHVFLTEGKTEFDVYTSVAQSLSDIYPDTFKSFESLGVATIDAGTDSQILPLASYFKSLGKTVFAAFDKQDQSRSLAVGQLGIYSFELPEKGIESAIINNTDEVELRRHVKRIISEGRWDSNVTEPPKEDTPSSEFMRALLKYLHKGKGDYYAAELLLSIEPTKIPKFVIDVISGIQSALLPSTSTDLTSDVDSGE
jgi:putative ATP-dependent endonuclease of OLD family